MNAINNTTDSALSLDDYTPCDNEKEKTVNYYIEEIDELKGL